MAISPNEFDAVRKIVYDRSAIVVGPGKEYLVEARLRPLASADGCTISELIRRLHLTMDPTLAGRVVDALTINETAFFRDGKPFETLRQVVLPEIIARKAARRTLNIWSAASSSGQEPYTIAMVLREHFPELAGWRVRILCTDISTEMVVRTKLGRYSRLEVGRGLPDALRAKYFTPVGNEWEVTAELKQWLDVRPLNLAARWPLLDNQDIVFCRNVLIYFDLQTKQTVLQRVRDVLSPNGYLFLGAAETTPRARRSIRECADR